MIEVGALVEKVRAKRVLGYRLVQICATALPGQLELTYSFDLLDRLASLRVHVPAEAACVPSISSVYSCAVLYENEMSELFNLRVDGMALDFRGTLYQTTVKFAFGATKAPTIKAPPAAQAAQ